MNPIEALKMHGVGVGKKLVGDAQSTDVRAGKTFSNAQGNDKQGTMPVRSFVAQTITPGVNNIIKQAGIYDGDITVEGDPDLVAANIASGKSIFGVSGTLTGKKFATGSQTASTTAFTVSGLSFRPRVALLFYNVSPSRRVYGYREAENYSFLAVEGGSPSVGDLTAVGVTITNSGFTITVSSGKTYSWIAYEE